MASVLQLHRVLESRLADVPIAVVDVETTGVHPSDRVIELAVLRLEPGCPPRMLIDTLVDPERPVTATHIHGITADDVIGAPTFRKIARDVEDALSGCVLVAYNACFDVRFLRQEFEAVGRQFEPPFMCLMNLSAHLRLATHCSLSRACAQNQIVRRNAHAASADAEAAAAIWQLCKESLSSQGYMTFRDLSMDCRYAFTKSFFNKPLSACAPRRIAWEPKHCDVSERAKRIGDWARAEELTQEIHCLFAARAELDRVQIVLRANRDAHRVDVAFKLLAAQLGLTSAGTQATPRDWERLYSMVARSSAA